MALSEKLDSAAHSPGRTPQVAVAERSGRQAIIELTSELHSPWPQLRHLQPSSGAVGDRIVSWSAPCQSHRVSPKLVPGGRCGRPSGAESGENRRRRDSTLRGYFPTTRQGSGRRSERQGKARGEKGCTSPAAGILAPRLTLAKDDSPASADNDRAEFEDQAK